jgi:transposase
MPNKCYHVHLSESERQQLDAFVKHGHKSARQINRARILLLADAQTRDEDIAAILGVSLPTIYKMRKKYCQNTSASILDLLQEQPRSGQPLKVDTRVESHVSMIACSDPPEGQARWTLQLIADKLVTLHVVDSICVESVRKALKKIDSNPGSRNAGVLGR